MSSCDTCQWASPDLVNGQALLFCRAEPPALMLTPQGPTTAFPAVMPKWWCRHWAFKAKSNPEDRAVLLKQGAR